MVSHPPITHRTPRSRINVDTDLAEGVKDFHGMSLVSDGYLDAIMFPRPGPDDGEQSI